MLASGRLAACIDRRVDHPPPVQAWAADRDGGRVVGLSEDWLEVRDAPMDAPLRVVARRDGGAWVLDAPGRRPDGPHRLVSIDASGAERGAWELGRTVDLAGLDGRGAIVCHRDGDRTRVAVHSPRGGPPLELEAHGVQAVAGRGGRLLLGFGDGRLRVHDLRAGGGLRDERALPAEVLDVAPGPHAGWWVLTALDGTRVHLLDDQLADRWDCATGLAARALAPVPGRAQVWAVCTERRTARRFGAPGHVEIDARELPLRGLERAAAWDAGAVLSAPGALLVLGPEGQLRQTQGGFDFLTDIDRSPR